MPGIPASVDISANPITQGDNFTMTVILDQTATSDTPIALACSNTSLITGPSGGAFPTSATVLSGHDRVAVALQAASGGTPGTVTLSAGPGGSSLPSGATASKQLTVSASGPGSGG